MGAGWFYHIGVLIIVFLIFSQTTLAVDRKDVAKDVLKKTAGDLGWPKNWKITY